MSKDDATTNMQRWRGTAKVADLENYMLDHTFQILLKILEIGSPWAPNWNTSIVPRSTWILSPRGAMELEYNTLQDWGQADSLKQTQAKVSHWQKRLKLFTKTQKHWGWYAATKMLFPAKQCWLLCHQKRRWNKDTLGFYTIKRKTLFDMYKPKKTLPKKCLNCVNKLGWKTQQTQRSAWPKGWNKYPIKPAIW